MLFLNDFYNIFSFNSYTDKFLILIEHNDSIFVTIALIN